MDDRTTPSGEVYEIDFAFREKLNAVAEGFRHNYCSQCGACVADCPANNYSDTFNPRLIMLKALLGFEHELLGPGSDIWNCTNCFNCYERCPQNVRPIEIIIALKNMLQERGMSPQSVTDILKNVEATGRTVVVNVTVIKRRQELGLPPLPDLPVDEIAELMKRGEEESYE